MQLQQPLTWLLAAADVSIVLAQQSIIAIPDAARHLIEETLCGGHLPSLHVTPASVAGLVLVAFGSLVRLTCFRRLGTLFTFDLTILPTHNLITNGPYAWVRHPAYTGTLSMCLGIALVNLTPGGWLVESGVLGRGSFAAGLRALGAAVWFGWWLAVGMRRCRAEDAELKKKFGSEWDVYASRVRYWYIPGVL